MSVKEWKLEELKENIHIFLSGFFFHFSNVCDGLSCIDIEALLRHILTHLLMPSEALCRFIQLGRNTVGVTQNECQNLQTWIGLSSGLLILSALLNTLPLIDLFFFPQKNLLSDSVLFSIFLNQLHCTRNKASRVVDLFFWQYWCSLTCLCHLTAVWKRKNGSNRIWIAVEVKIFLLPAMAPNQATDGDEVPVAAALIAQALQQCWK